VEVVVPRAPPFSALPSPACPEVLLAYRRYVCRSECPPKRRGPLAGGGVGGGVNGGQVHMPRRRPLEWRRRQTRRHAMSPQVQAGGSCLPVAGEVEAGEAEQATSRPAGV